MQADQPIRWRKSTKCDTGNCVEAAELDDTVAVRDSKDPNGPILRFTKEEWSSFVAGIRDGEFDFR